LESNPKPRNMHISTNISQQTWTAIRESRNENVKLAMTCNLIRWNQQNSTDLKIFENLEAATRIVSSTGAHMAIRRQPHRCLRQPLVKTKPFIWIWIQNILLFLFWNWPSVISLSKPICITKLCKKFNFLVKREYKQFKKKHQNSNFSKLTLIQKNKFQEINQLNQKTLTTLVWS